MKAIDKIRLILGEEDFERFKGNFNGWIGDLERFCEEYQQRTLYFSFKWTFSPEGWRHWKSLHNKLIEKWNTIEDTIIYPRAISAEEHDEIFKMFVCEWMGWKTDENMIRKYFDMRSYPGAVYDALRSEE